MRTKNRLLFAVVGTFALFSTCACTPKYFFPFNLKEIRELASLDKKATFSKGPYLRYLGPGSVVVGVELPPGENAALYYWPEGKERSSRAIAMKPRWDRIHTGTLRGLRLNSTYEYKVKYRDQFSKTYQFRAGASQNKPFRFVAVGDTREGDRSAHIEVIEQMQKRRSDFVIHLGDFVNGGANVDDWNWFFRIETPLLSESPIIPVIGNHDLSRAGFFSGLFFLRQQGKPRRYFSTSYGNSYFIALDSNVEFQEFDAQYRFLSDSLEMASQRGMKHIFVLLHHPIYNSGHHGYRNDLRDFLSPLFEKYKVRAVLSGHEHAYQRY